MRNITPILKKAAVIILVAIICLLVLPGVKPVTALPARMPSSKAELLAEPAAYERIPSGADLERPGGNAPSQDTWPTTKTVDEEGYTVWTADYGDISWCVPVSTLHYPIDLGEQDTSELYDVTLRLRFDQDYFLTLYDQHHSWHVVRDPTWSVGFNSHPYDFWQIVGSITGTQPFSGRRWENSPYFRIDKKLLNDGVNYVWLKQHDLCPETLLDSVACTCITLNSVQLRAGVAPLVKSVSPKDGARNVWFDQTPDSEIRVEFNTVISNTTVDENTFKVYYFDQAGERAYIDGEVKPLSETEFVFVPAENLMDGVRYVAEVLGQQEAEELGQDKWVKNLRGDPLEHGRDWYFWTIPNLQVNLVPVQVLENKPLVVNKPTILRTFVRWDKKPNVHVRNQLNTVVVDDVTLVWTAAGGEVDTASWGSGYQWQPERNKRSAQRKREYLEYTNPAESYTNREKWYSNDSINYLGFTPRTASSYMLLARVEVKDNKGKPRYFIDEVNTSASTTPRFGVYWKAVAVGNDYGNTGTVDLSAPIVENTLSMIDIFPVATIGYPADAAMMAWYTPTTSLWLYDWSTEPGGMFSKEYLLQEMSALCDRTTGCRAMVGLTSPGWLVDGGLTDVDGAWRGALIRNNSIGANLYTATHEIGHLARFEHAEEAAGEGYDVRTRTDKRYSVDQDVFDFMTWEPVQSAAKTLWINNWHYQTLGMWTGAWRLEADGFETAPNLPQTQSADPLLQVSGIITETTGAVTVWPWYQMAPGEWQAPPAGAYNLVFVNGGGQEIAGYTRSFSVGGDSQPRFFTFVTPYPATMAKVQIRRIADNALLKEFTPSASAPTVSIDPPGSSPWQGPKPITWQTDPGTRYFALDVSTDNGATWEALAIHLTGKSYTIQTTALPNTTQALVRVSASDGLRTTTTSAGPFTIDNPPLVAYVSPSPGATGVGINETIVAGFPDAMDPATITATTFTLAGGPFGTVPGTIVYDAENHETTFTPKAALAFSTTYTATLTTGIKDAGGTALPAARRWSFNTAGNRMPPQPLVFTPQEGALDVPLNASLAVVWDEALNPATVSAATFSLATLSGTPVSGAVTYNATTRAASFVPGANLAPDTTYVATLKAGIQDTHSNATEGDFIWSFTTGDVTDNKLGFTDAYFDYGVDSNGDGLYEQLVILAGVRITSTDIYTLTGTLADNDGVEITRNSAYASYLPGTQFLKLVFDGAAIGGHGADGPYTLANLTICNTAETGLRLPLGYLSGDDLFRTFAYTAGQFPAVLRFSGLPDLWVEPGTVLDPAFDVHDYAHPVIASSAQLTYTLLANTELNAGVTFTDSVLRVNPQANWRGSSDVTIQASYGADSAQDTFRVNVGWQNQLYLPVTMRFNSGVSSQSRTGWRTAFSQDFESGFTYWGSFSTISIPPGGWYQWGIRDCAAFSGSHSAWAFGGAEDGSVLPCGSSYPNTLKSTIYYRPAVNLKYTNAAEFSVKLWSNLAAGDQVCIMATTDEIDEDWPLAAQLYGNCRGGATNGWENFKLDLSQVPVLGNLLGREKIWVAVKFIADQSGTLTGGAYIDDAVLRVCPQGLICQP